MNLITESVDYSNNGINFKGYLAYDGSRSGKRPAVIVAPAYKGNDEIAHKKAEDLARLGYIGFAADIYGNGKTVETDEEASALMMPLFLDRKELRQRILAAYNTIKQNKSVNPEKIAAIGFCFGGLNVIELLRSGVSLKGIVTFHSLFGNSMGEMHAKTEPAAKKLHGSVLMLQGHDDPLVSLEDILNIQQEFTDAKLDWQLNIYGNTSHAFTNPKANNPKAGLIYNELASKRAWQSMRNFLEQIFS